MAAPWTVGSIVARLQLDTSPFYRGLQTVVQQIRTFSTTTAKAFHGVMTPVRALGGTFGWLERQVFSLRTILLGVAGVKFVGLAGDAEDLSNAFEHLQGSLNLTASNTLKAMRGAIKGTVSDMDLMREANNALLLGAAHTTEQFALLADAGRRLGKAVGRDPLQGIQDLATGIGRMSYRVLDNLGLIVKAQDAYDKWKTKMGIVGRELTTSEQRLAFQSAAYEQIRDKLAQLGPDTLSFSDHINRLKASLLNLTVKISLELRPLMTKIANWVENLVTEKGPQITAFVALVQEAVLILVDALRELWERLRSGETTLGEVFAAWGESVHDYIVGPLIQVFIAGAQFIATTFWAAFGQAFKNQWTAFKTAMAKDLSRDLALIGGIASKIPGWQLLGTGFQAAAAGISQLQESPESRAKAETRAYEDQQVRLMWFQAALYNLKASAGKLVEGIGDAVRNVGIKALGQKWVDEAAARLNAKYDALQKAGKKAAEGTGDAVRDEVGRVREIVDDLDDTWQKFLSHVDELRKGAVTAGMDEFEKALYEVSYLLAHIDDSTMSLASKMRYLEAEAVAYGSVYLTELERQAKAMGQAEKQVEETLAKTRFDRRSLGMTEREKALAGIEEDYAAAAPDLPLADRSKLRARYDELKKETALLLEETRSRDAWKGLGNTLTDTVAGGIARGLAEGKKFSEVWADVTGRLFQESLDKAISSLSETVQTTLANIMEKLGAGAGWAGLGTGLLGLAGVILGSLKGKGESTVEDFANQVNSSEAIRGVVAGPTNVAISKIGDSLKTSLRGTEILLEKILRAIEAGGGVPGGSSMPRSAVYPLTAATGS